MSNIHVLVGGSNYSGSWTVYQSLPDVNKIVQILREDFNVPKSNITGLYGHTYTANNIIGSLKILARKLKSPGKIGFVYFAGHGTQINDRNHDEEDGRDEALQTHDHRLVTDDQITAALLEAHSDNWIVLVADTCHSPSLDHTADTRNKKWISIKAALDHQSALQSGDGSCMSVQLFSILKNLDGKKIKINELAMELSRLIRESFVGELQSSKVEVSNENLWGQDFPLC